MTVSHRDTEDAEATRLNRVRNLRAKLPPPVGTQVFDRELGVERDFESCLVPNAADVLAEETVSAADLINVAAERDGGVATRLDSPVSPRSPRRSIT